MRKGLTKKANDLTALAPKWSERGHLLAALPKHLAETQEAIKTQQNIDKEMTDLALIASAWMKSQQQKELLEARLKRFKETAGYPSMASVKPDITIEKLARAEKFGAAMVKRAIHVEEGGLPSRLVASTIGRIGGLPNLILSGNALTDPSRSITQKFLPERFDEHKRQAELISEYDPKALKDVVLRLGGVNTIDDIIWKKDRGENLPWYKRIGGRVLHNPQISIPNRLLHMPITLLGNLLTPLLRASHYNRASNSIAEFMHEPAVTQHELGHALDFNTIYGLNPGEGSLGKRSLKHILGDAYEAAYFTIPGANLIHEARANMLSDAALRKVLGAGSKEYRQNAIRRAEVLPAGYASYVGNLVTPALGGLPGMIIGKQIGRQMAADLRKRYGKDL